MTYNYLI